MNAIELLLDSNRGVYIPQNFAEEIDTAKFTGIGAADLETLKAGPDAEWYWEAWENVLNNAEYRDGEHVYRLHQDGDLFIVCPDKLSDQEYFDFFGDYRS